MPDSTLFEAIESTTDKDQLEKIIASAQARRDEVMKQHRQEIKQQIRELAASADLGVDVWDLSTDGKKAKPRKSMARQTGRPNTAIWTIQTRPGTATVPGRSG